jgi:hypothetical protein
VIAQAAGYIALGMRHLGDEGGQFAHVGCIRASFHNQSHQGDPTAPTATCESTATCECCGDEFVPPCPVCENAFNFAVRELVESGAVAMRETDDEMSLFVADRARLDAVPEPRWRA